MDDKDFIDISEEEIEILDFETDKKVSNEIDEMLDFIDTPLKNPEEEKSLETILEKVEENSENNVQIDASKEKLDEYVPSIKDFNIKSARKRKIISKVMVYSIILMLIGFEFIVERAGSTLNDLRVYASNNEPIRIVQNDKYGYIDYTGNKIVNPKYQYGENFVKGYAIVKNSSNLPLIIDKAGKEVIKTGTYFSIYRADTDIIASKVTDKGLKYGVLDANLKQKVAFKYDSISYVKNAYTYINSNEVGVINVDGKKIYSYKLTDSDDKSITVNPSNVNDKISIIYGVVKVNATSLIINLTDGTVSSGATLNTISAEDNNVFLETSSDGKKTYKYIYDNKVLVESEDYSSMIVDSISSGVIKAVTNDFKSEYISTKTLEQYSKNIADTDTFLGKNIFIYRTHNYRKNNDNYYLVKNGEVFKILTGISDISSYKNGAAIVKYSDGKYGYVNEDGNYINEDHYEEANDFDEYGDAIVKKDGYYGVINIAGKIILDYKYEEILMASSNVKKLTSVNNKNAFYATREENKYILFNSKGKKINNEKYNDLEFNDIYGIVKASTDEEDILIITKDMKKINLTSFKTEYEAFENYVVIDNEYYNYNGKLIFVDNSNREGN